LGDSGGINPVYFSISNKKEFYALSEDSRSAKSAVENSRGLLFDTYQEQLGWGRYAMTSPEGLDGVGIGGEARQEICTDTSVRTG
jgi:hypothetical protein